MKIIKYLSFTACVALSAIVMNGCTKDEGNYEYTASGNEISFGLMNSGSSFTVAEDVIVEPIIEINDPTIKESDLTYKWRVNGVETEYTGASLNLGKLPAGDYTWDLIITDTRYGTTYSRYSDFTVTAEFVDGWMTLVNKGGKSELCYLQLAEDGEPKELKQDVYSTANSGEELGSDPRKLAYHYYTDPMAGGVYLQLGVYQGGGQGGVELYGGSMIKDVNMDQLFMSAPSSTPVNGYYRKYGNIVLLEDGSLYFKNDVEIDGTSVPHSSKFGTPLYVEGGIKASHILPMNVLSDNKVMPYANAQFCVVYDELNSRFLTVSSFNKVNSGKIHYMESYGSDAIQPGFDVEGASEALKWPFVSDLSEYDMVATMVRDVIEDNGGESCVASILKRKSDGKYFYFQFRNWALTAGEDVDLKMMQEFSGGEYLNDNSVFVPILTGSPYIYFTGGAGNNELYTYNVYSGSCVKVYTANSEITAIKPGIISNGWLADWGYGDISCYTNQVLLGTQGGDLVLFDISSGANSMSVVKEWAGVGEVVDIEFVQETTGYFGL